tara:strand:+ start:2372 stop:2824 length:453 start_codon:yes stop_codon:yes gene_type:complete
MPKNKALLRLSEFWLGPLFIGFSVALGYCITYGLLNFDQNALKGIADSQNTKEKIFLPNESDNSSYSNGLTSSSDSINNFKKQKEKAMEFIPSSIQSKTSLQITTEVIQPTLTKESLPLEVRLFFKASNIDELIKTLPKAEITTKSIKIN